MTTGTRARMLGLTVLAVVAGACDKGAQEESRASVARDSSLARDLQLAADTTPYSEAADVAMRELDTTTYVRDLPRAGAPARDRTPGPARMPSPARRPAETSVPVSPAPSISTPRPAPVEGVTRRESACESPAMADQRRCLLAALASSDVGLDRTYQGLIADLKRQAGTQPGEREPDSVQRLREAQRAWLVYRDTECRRRNRGQEGPLWAPVRARCLGEFSGARAQELAATRARLNAR